MQRGEQPSRFIRQPVDRDTSADHCHHVAHDTPSHELAEGAGELGADRHHLRSDGNLYASDCRNSGVYVVRGSHLSIIAGGGKNGQNTGFAGDGGPATDARFTCPFGLAFDQAGDLFEDDLHNNRVRMIDPAGTVTTVVGTGNPVDATLGAYPGDGGPATEVQLSTPTWAATDTNGDLFIADRDHNRVRMVDPNGIITTIAGTSVPGFSGDGGLGNRRRSTIRKASPSTRVVTWSSETRTTRGSGWSTATVRSRRSPERGSPGDTGDGGPADQARIEDISGLTIAADGTIYFTQQKDHVIRAIDPHGVVRTVVGIGQAGCPVDGKPATEVSLKEMGGLAVDAQGHLLFAVGGCGIYRVGSTGTIELVAAAGGS